MPKRLPRLTITEKFNDNFGSHKIDGEFKYKGEKYHSTITYVAQDSGNMKDAKKELSLWMKSLITDIDNDSK